MYKYINILNLMIIISFTIKFINDNLNIDRIRLLI